MLISAIYAVVFVTNVILFNPFIESNINYTQNDIKNTILIIGDGMGENHIKATSVYAQRKLNFENFLQTGFVNTLSYSGITDSGAAATAMAAGQKIRNGGISRHAGQDLTTIVEIAKDSGKKTGVITSDVLSGATAAAFSAHATNRYDTEDIINSQINGQVDLLIGEGEAAYSQYSSEIIGAGYEYLTDINNFNNTSNKVFATLPAIEPNQTATSQSINMSNVAFALDFLENEEGFLLVIEVSDIDKRSHDNNLEAMIYEMLMLEAVVQTVASWAQNRQDTLIFLTGDHETGGLILDEIDTYENLQNTYEFKTSGHTKLPVPFYALGYDLGEDYIDNIDIFKLFNFIITKTIPN
jgi:alkaline phosphatase